MPVLIERFALVITCRNIRDLYPGGWERFQFDISAYRWCSDGQLVCLSFTDPGQMFAFRDDCEDTVSHAGLRGAPRSDPCRLEMHPFDHLRGPILPCRFLGFRVLRLDASPALVSVAWLKSPRQRTTHVTRIAHGEFAAPQGWQFEGSVSEAGQLIRRGWNALAPGH